MLSCLHITAQLSFVKVSSRRRARLGETAAHFGVSGRQPHPHPVAIGIIAAFLGSHDPKRCFHIHLGLGHPAAIHASPPQCACQPVLDPSSTVPVRSSPAREPQTPASPSRPSPCALRQANSSGLEIPFAATSPMPAAESIAFLDEQQLLFLRPAAPAASINNLETSDSATVSTDIVPTASYSPTSGKATLITATEKNAGKLQRILAHCRLQQEAPSNM